MLCLPGSNRVLADSLVTSQILGCAPRLNLHQRSENLRLCVLALAHQFCPLFVQIVFQNRQTQGAGQTAKADGILEEVTRAQAARNGRLSV